MNKMRTKFLTAMLATALIFSLMPLSQEAFGKDSKPELCWTMDQRGADSSEVLRTYSLPPAWDNPGDEQEPPQRPKIIKLIAFNESK